MMFLGDKEAIHKASSPVDWLLSTKRLASIVAKDMDIRNTSYYVQENLTLWIRAGCPWAILAERSGAGILL